MNLTPATFPAPSCASRPHSHRRPPRKAHPGSAQSAMASLPHDPVRAFGCSGSWGGIEGSGETLSPMAVVGRATGTPTGALGTRQGPPAADSGGGQGRGQEGTGEGRNGRDGMEGGGYPPPKGAPVVPRVHTGDELLQRRRAEGALLLLPGVHNIRGRGGRPSVSATSAPASAALVSAPRPRSSGRLGVLGDQPASASARLSLSPPQPATASARRSLSRNVTGGDRAVTSGGRG